MPATPMSFNMTTTRKAARRPVPGTIGERVYNLRISAGESQKDLADAIEITQSTISKIELGKIEPKAHDLSRIAKHYKVDPGYLTDGLGGVSKTINDIKEIIQVVEALERLHQKGALTEEQFKKLSQEAVACSIPRSFGE